MASVIDVDLRRLSEQAAVVVLLHAMAHMWYVLGLSAEHRPDGGAIHPFTYICYRGLPGGIQHQGAGDQVGGHCAALSMVFLAEEQQGNGCLHLPGVAVPRMTA